MIGPVTIVLANQLDLMAVAALDMVWDLSESVPEELRALLIHLSRTTQSLSFNAASFMAEMLRLRRDLILSSIQPGFLLEPGLNSLKTAPFTADTLFGGKDSSCCYGGPGGPDTCFFSKKKCWSAPRGF